jgi:hypothetical protein
MNLLSLVLGVVANQIDKPFRRVEPADVIEYARSIGAHYFEVSAKKNIGEPHLIIK